jgi:hypothetical protein
MKRFNDLSSAILLRIFASEGMDDARIEAVYSNYQSCIEVVRKTQTICVSKEKKSRSTCNKCGQLLALGKVYASQD